MAKYDQNEFFKAERKQSVIDNLVKGVLDAEEELIKHEIMANTVVLNGRKYGFLMKQGYYPTICGLKMEFDNLPDEMDFVVQKRPQTNADRIRAMSDEELAFILASPSVVIPPWCVPHLECPHMDKDPVPCDECALDWLKSPVDET